MIILPPTEQLLAACEHLERVITRLIAARDELDVGRYEADVEACLLFNLVLRHVESVLVLARHDMVLLPAAFTAARAAFETSNKAAWLIDADDPFEREARWLAHLGEEERVYQRAMARAEEASAKSSFGRYAADLGEFKTAVAALMPSHIKPLKGNPNLEEICRSIGGDRLYAMYIYLSQFVHGGHLATSLYRQNLGIKKEFGEYIRHGHWYIALRICWLSLSHPVDILLSRLATPPIQYLSPAERAAVEGAIEAINSESIRTLH